MHLFADSSTVTVLCPVRFNSNFNTDFCANYANLHSLKVRTTTRCPPEDIAISCQLKESHLEAAGCCCLLMDDHLVSLRCAQFAVLVVWRDLREQSAQNNHLCGVNFPAERMWWICVWVREEVGDESNYCCKMVIICWSMNTKALKLIYIRHPSSDGENIIGCCISREWPLERC